MADRTASQKETAKDGKKQALDLALTQIEKQFGKGAIMKLGGAEIPADIPAISTGSLTLDMALGIGGLPRGRVVEIYGPEASGKTTLCLHAIAEAQKSGGAAAFIDAEHALDISLMPRNLAWKQMICLSRNRILGNRPWKSPKH